jgi:hypothetical protein
MLYDSCDSGGGRGIRTPEEPYGPLIDFESIAFVHSAIPPYRSERHSCRFRPQVAAHHLWICHYKARSEPPTRHVLVCRKKTQQVEVSER